MYFVLYLFSDVPRRSFDIKLSLCSQNKDMKERGIRACILFHSSQCNLQGIKDDWYWYNEPTKLDEVILEIKMTDASGLHLRAGKITMIQSPSYNVHSHRSHIYLKDSGKWKTTWSLQLMSHSECQIGSFRNALFTHNIKREKYTVELCLLDCIYIHGKS